MDIIAAFVLGIVEGLTEYIPVSSTGHLILAAKALSFEGAAAESFEIFIQLGAILAVVILYWNRFTGLLQLGAAPGKREGFSGREGMTKLALGCLPAFVFGAVLHSTIKRHLFGPYPVAAALIFGGIVMILIERRSASARVNALESISYSQCLFIGLFQCFALWPGISRSGATIVGGLLLGLERRVAAEFSFLVAVPVMAAAVSYDLLKSFDVLRSSDAAVFSVGFITSFITAVFAIRFFLKLLGKWTLAPFGLYRIILGLVVLAVLVW